MAVFPVFNVGLIVPAWQWEGRRMQLHARAIAALKHLGWSAAVAMMVAAVVFGLWFPAPYDRLAGGMTLFMLVVAVDVISGPLLTLVVYDLKKPRAELRRDIAIIVMLQLSALSYGLYSVAEARPVFLAYEGNRFRLVSVADIDHRSINDAPAELRRMSYSGPRLISTRLADENDADYQSSLMQSLAGFHPSFRPSRWQSYDSLKPELRAALLSLDGLMRKHPESSVQIQQVLEAHGLAEETAGYLPLDAEKANPVNWSVIVDRRSGLPRAFLPLDGW